MTTYRLDSLYAEYDAGGSVTRLRPGADGLGDFTPGVDLLILDAALWSGTLTPAQAVGQFASVQGGDVVFDFGGGEVLTLEGLSSAGLRDALLSSTAIV